MIIYTYVHVQHIKYNVDTSAIPPASLRSFVHCKATTPGATARVPNGPRRPRRRRGTRAPGGERRARRATGDGDELLLVTVSQC